MMHQLLTNWQGQPEFMRKLIWYFMPVLSPDGYEYIDKDGRGWRKNRSPTGNSSCTGVDLNRNFDISWSSLGSSSDPCHPVYHGPSVGSELETQAVKKFLIKNKKNLKSYLTFHSHAQMLIYPWSYKKELVEDAADLQRVGDLATERIKAKTGLDFKTIPGEDFYYASGTSQDWSRQSLNVKYTYSVELRNKDQLSSLPPDQIIPSRQNGFIVAYTVAEAVGAL